MHFKVILTLLFTVITVNNSENKFDTFKNVNKSSQNQGTDEQQDMIKKEIKKYMSECGAEVSNEDSSESTYNNRNSSSSNNSNNKGGNNRDQQNHGNNRYGNQNSNNHRDNSGYGQNYGDSYPSHDYNRDQGRNYPQTSYGSWGSSGQGSYSNPHENMNDNRSGFGNTNRNYGYGQYGHDSSGYGVRQGGIANNKKGYYGSEPFSSGRDSFNFDGGYVRPKRSEDDVECISQCVFGYLEVLDDNRSPSEAAMIKWFQDHLPNDGKRIKAIRDARRCFARLAATDNDDGCDFSKSLSKCLNLDIEK